MKLFFFDMKPSTMSVALSFVLLTGCVTTKPEPDAWLEDKNLVVQSLQDAHVENAKLKEKLNELDLRLLGVEKQNVEQQTKIIILESALQQRSIELAKPKKPNKPKVSKKNASLNKRLNAMAAKLTPPIKPDIIPSVSASTIQTDADEKNAYTAAYLALKSGRYDESSAGFVKVIKAHPKGEYTDQAYYWLGESLVALLRYKEALESFTVVADQYPKSAKHAAALLKVALVYKSMKQPEEARIALERVIKEYPDGRTAERARNELKALPQADGVKK